MPVLVRELNHFVLDRRTVAWTTAVDLPAVHRGSMQIRFDQFMHIRIGVGDPAGQLINENGAGFSSPG